MDSSVLEKLKDTRISGRLIEIKPDRGPGARRNDGPRDGARGGFERRDERPRYDRDERPARGDRDEKPFRKPRHKA